MQAEDDVAIEVDEALDQLTELIVIPTGSPVHAVRRAIVLRPPSRPTLIVMPEDAEAPARGPRAPCATLRRSTRLTAFAAFSLRASPAKSA